jgi:hypothetical protein
MRPELIKFVVWGYPIAVGVTLVQMTLNRLFACCRGSQVVTPGVKGPWGGAKAWDGIEKDRNGMTAHRMETGRGWQ